MNTDTALVDRAREFINEYVKTLPLRVQLNGITQQEKDEAASICVDFAAIEIKAERERTADSIEVAMKPTDHLDQVLNVWELINKLRGKL